MWNWIILDSLWIVMNLILYIIYLCLMDISQKYMLTSYGINWVTWEMICHCIFSNHRLPMSSTYLPSSARIKSQSCLVIVCDNNSVWMTSGWNTTQMSCNIPVFPVPKLARSELKHFIIFTMDWLNWHMPSEDKPY